MAKLWTSNSICSYNSEKAVSQTFEGQHGMINCRGIKKAKKFYAKSVVAHEDWTDLELGHGRSNDFKITTWIHLRTTGNTKTRWSVRTFRRNLRITTLLSLRLFFFQSLIPGSDFKSLTILAECKKICKVRSRHANEQRKNGKESGITQ